MFMVGDLTVIFVIEIILFSPGCGIMERLFFSHLYCSFLDLFIEFLLSCESILVISMCKEAYLDLHLQLRQGS